MKSARTFIRYARISPIGTRSQGLGNRKIARASWAKHDSTEYVDWSKAKRVQLAKLKPSTETISLRLPKYLLDSIRQIAKSRDVPYQSLIKIWLQEHAVERR